MPKNPTSAATPITYADAGVDIDVANRTKKRIKYLAHKTFTRGVLSEIGGFGGLFAVDKAKYLDPVLVSSVDGVGTKLKIAFEMGLHSTVGADLVNHCVNDIAVQGAAPLFFMDYLATGKLEPSIAEQIVEGIADACKHNGCALIGGETAEMPGFYPKGEYDLAGFIVGVVERDRIITGKEVQIGDVVLGMASNGLHTNGYSLARKLLFEVAQYSTEDYVNEIKNKVGNELMRTHKSYSGRRRRLILAPGRCRLCLSICGSWETFLKTKCCVRSTWDWACCWWCRWRNSRRPRPCSNVSARRLSLWGESSRASEK